MYVEKHQFTQKEYETMKYIFSLYMRIVRTKVIINQTCICKGQGQAQEFGIWSVVDNFILEHCTVLQKLDQGCGTNFCPTPAALTEIFILC